MDILYEDNDLVIINKPPGILVHADGVLSDETVSDWMVRTYPESQGVGEAMRLKDGTVVERHGVVHRLDAETSGALILAKTQEAHAHLKAQFQAYGVEKTYYAFIHGAPKEKEGIIDVPIGRSAKDFRLKSAQRGARGALREALTHYWVEKETFTHAFVRLQPKTGRTHQLRVHMKYIHHEILCDRLYAPKKPCDLGFSRLALHAGAIRFTALDGKELHIEAPFPEDFELALSTF